MQLTETTKEQPIVYLVCDNWNWRQNKAVVHIRGGCYPQRDPGAATLYTQWFGPYDSLDAALSKAEATGRAVGKCGNCFRRGPLINLT